MAGPAWRGRRAPIGVMVVALAFVSAVATAQGAAVADVGLLQHSVTEADAPSSMAPGRVLVKFRAGTTTAMSAEALAADGVTLGRLGRTGVRTLRVAPGRELEVLRSLRRRSSVEYAELDYAVAADGPVPTDPLYASNQWDLPLINMPDAWAATVGAGVLVAVVDTGIDMSHEDLLGQWTYSPSNNDPSAHVILSGTLSSGCSLPSQPTDDSGTARTSPGRSRRGARSRVGPPRGSPAWRQAPRSFPSRRLIVAATV